MKHLKTWQFKLPSPRLRAIVSHYEFINFGDETLGDTELLYLPNLNNAFLFYSHNQEPITSKNSLRREEKVPTGSLIPPINTPTLNKGLKDLTATRIIFQPGALWKLYGIPMNNFINQNLDLRIGFDNHLGFTQEALSETTCYNEQIRIIEKYLSKKNKTASCNGKLYAVLNKLLLSSCYSVKNQSIADSLGITSRHLRRLVTREFGYTVREFINIHRVNNILKDLEKADTKSLTELAYKYSYFDQSHFIREFKRRTGFTPSLLAKKGEMQQQLLLRMQGKGISEKIF